MALKKSNPTLGVLLLVLLHLSKLSSGNNDTCQDLYDYFSGVNTQPFRTPVVRIVSPTSYGSDTPDCLCRRSPCATPRYALYGEAGGKGPNATASSNITIILETGVHVLNESLLIHSTSNVSFVGAKGAIVECGKNPDIDNCNLLNVHVSNSSFINFYGITFQNCGLRISSVHVQYSNNVVFNNCRFRNNTSSAVHLYQVDAVAFHSCHFDSNIQKELDPNVSYPACYRGQNDKIFFLDSRPTAGGLSLYANGMSIKLLISRSTFENNFARPNEAADKNLARALLPFGHGGGMFVRLVESSQTKVCIDDSTFYKNSAEANGGAMQLSAAQDSLNNEVVIRNSNFTKNKCILDSCTGGVIGIDYFENSHNNIVHFINSSFYDNYAVAGGVLSLLTSVGTDPSEDLLKPLLFKDCLFEHNMAKEDGSVLSLFSVTQINELGFPAFIENCRFQKNIALEVNELTPAVSVFRVSITFEEENIFYNNFGGGLTLTESRANVNGHLTFDHNFADNGGGIAMYGRCLLELYNGSTLEFYNNFALRRGGSMYVEYVSADFIFSILNRGCFLQYYSEIDQPPNKWNSTVSFINNTAGEAGAAIYASDMSRCQWYGSDHNNTEEQPIFVPVDDYNSPFTFENNVIANNDETEIKKVALATDAVNMNITSDLENITNAEYSYTEQAQFFLSTFDQFDNFREALWQVSALGEEELGAISSENTPYSYDIPDKKTVSSSLNKTNESIITLTFTVNTVSSEVDAETYNLKISNSPCHPGYNFAEGKCECESGRKEIVRCDGLQRYFYVQEGLWVGSGEEYSNGLIFAPAIPGFLNCTNEGNLPGCLYTFDDPDSQCADGRTGVLCSKCKEGYGISFDLLSCQKNCHEYGGILIYVIICVVTVIVSLVVLYFDVRIPNKLKGLIFFGQVIGVIYRNSPYLNKNNNTGDKILNFFVNLLGSALPIPYCFHKNVSGLVIAWLGIVPPSLALATALIYIKLAQRLTILRSAKKNYGLHGLHLITLFIYKYFLDTAFTFVNVRKIDSQEIFSYSGESIDDPLVKTTLCVGIVLIIILGVVAPIVCLVYIYRPQHNRNFVDAFTRGLKEKKRYLWYSVWDIWRRLPFVAVNLLVSVTTVSIIVLMHVFLVLFVLSVHCVTKPYVRDFINVIEAAVIFCLFGAALAILDENDIYVQKETAIAFILLPLLYGLLYVVYLMIRLILKKAKIKDIDMMTFMKNILSDAMKKLPQPPKQNSEEENNDTVQTAQTDLQEENPQKKVNLDYSSSPHLREPLLDTM